MPDIQVSENGILKLLKNLNFHMAADPAELKPLVPKKLREVTVPILKVVYSQVIHRGW